MESKQIKKDTIKKDIYSANCKYCNKYLESFYLNQLIWNLKSHEDRCKKNPRNKEIKNEQ